MINYILIHGGMVGGWTWSLLRSHLIKTEQTVFCPTLSGLDCNQSTRSELEPDLKTHIEDVKTLIESEDLENIVLVGHSYGGIIAAAIAEHFFPRIHCLIYVDAVIPQDGKSMYDVIDQTISASIKGNVITKGQAQFIPPTCATAYGFSDSKIIDWFNANAASQPSRTFSDPVFLPSNQRLTVPTLYIKAEHDHSLDNMIPIALGLGFQFKSISSGHFPMITHPQELAKLILEYTECISPST